ncbi:hypothetical protein ASG73_00540 [Janibacter sp. Soil728]|uniref:DUF2809 domain-containing protein n=1 Tax=Janibacter sp. Soil728 TaxID=1736393 RepID=UPI0006F9D993|nr:DUF2809 domain-containing protein [Janibacter sp. Soil728]KRE38894.1 hypothetical protein ASG73_00540 [Janibacter sp. Soil728]
MAPVPRVLSASCLAAVVVAGLAVQLVRQLAWADAAGSVLYAMAACFAISVLWRGRPAAVAGAAFVACVLVELAQLTGIPARLPALSLLLGSGFDPRDIGWYAVGSVLGAGVMALGARRGSRTQRVTRHAPCP